MVRPDRLTYFSTLLFAALALTLSACADSAPTDGGTDGQPIRDASTGGDVPGGDGFSEDDASGDSGPQPCESDEDCPEGTICAADRSGGEVRTVCLEPNEEGGAVGESCSDDADCRANLCLDGVCTKPCARPVQCMKDGWTCDSATVDAEDGSSTEINVCQPAPAKECESDEDCPEGDRCVAERGTDEIEFTCGEPNPDGGSVGDSCSSDSECTHNLCVDGTCAPPCGRREHCSGADGFRCETTSVDLDNGNSDSASICVPPRPCDVKDECRVDEVCYVQRDRTDAAGICRDPNPGGGSLGENCQGDGQCAANLCYDSRFRKICSVPCEDENDCPASGFQCEETEIADGSGGTRTEKICVPSPPKSCDIQADCDEGRSCAIVVEADGSGLESVCIPDPGGVGTGNSCSDDEDCNSQLCLDGNCADPCLNRSQCANDQVCSTKTIEKDGETGTFDVCETLPEEECTSDGTCSDNVRICSRLRTRNSEIKAFCRFSNSNASGQLGDSCSSDSECRSGLCLSEIGSDSPLIGQCSVACRQDSQCATGQVCTSLPFQNTDVAVCTKPCLINDDCDSSNTCQVNENRINSPYTVDPVCMQPPGSGILGETCGSGGECKSGLCLNTYTFKPGDPNDQECTPGQNDCPSGWGCHEDPSRSNDTFCAEEERRCTRLCQNDPHCSGGTAENQLTSCESDVQLTLSDGTTRNVTACAQPE